VWEGSEEGTAMTFTFHHFSPIQNDQILKTYISTRLGWSWMM
jgi:hypothetical protein